MMNGGKLSLVIGLILSLIVIMPRESISQGRGDSFVAEIIQLRGVVEYRESSQHTWKHAWKTQKIYNGYHLRTGFNTRALIVYTSGTRVLLNENTEITSLSRYPLFIIAFLLS